MRSKRPDVRPNAKQRMKISRKLEEEKTIQDMRVTKKQKGEKKERECQSLPLRDPNQLTEDEKYVRTLKKKLKAIDDLISRQKKGEILDEQQLEKVDKLSELLVEFESVVKATSSERT